MKPLQRVVDAALRLATTGRSKNKTAISAKILHKELDISSIFSIATSRRIRAWVKWRELHTWIADLIKHPYWGLDTWGLGSSIIYHNILRKAGMDPQRPEDRSAKELAQAVKKALCHKDYEWTAMNAAGGYRTYLLEKTSRYIHLGIRFDQPYMLTRLLRSRLNAWPGLVYRLKRHHPALTEYRDAPWCPSCHQPEADTLLHLGLLCQTFEDDRETLLSPLLRTITTFLQAHNFPVDHETLWHACLGGIETTDSRISQLFVSLWLGPQKRRRQRRHLDAGEPHEADQNPAILEQAEDPPPPWIQIILYLQQILPKHFRTIKTITQPDGEEDDEEVLDLNREDGPVIERADSGVRFDITERRDRDDRMDSTNVHDVLERNVAAEANLIATNDINNQVDSSLSLPQAPRGLGVDAPICVWQHLTDPTRSAHSRTEGVG